MGRLLIWITTIVASCVLIEMETGSFSAYVDFASDSNYKNVTNGSVVDNTMSWEWFWDNLSEEERQAHPAMPEEEKYALWQRKMTEFNSHPKSSPQETPRTEDSNQNVPEETPSNSESWPETGATSEIPAEPATPESTNVNADSNQLQEDASEPSPAETTQEAPQAAVEPPVTTATTQESPPNQDPPPADNPPPVHVNPTGCTPADRRALAKAGGSEEDWKTMTYCSVRNDNQNRIGHFFQHISKSGGTSAIRVFDLNQCYNDPTKKGKPNFLLNIKRLGFDCNWINYERVKNYGFHVPFFANMNPKLVQGTLCEDMRTRMGWKFRMGISSEAVVPFESEDSTRGLCDDFVNSIIFREPLKRIESHYRHINKICKHREYCDRYFFVPGTDKGKYNSTFMAHAFDVLSDNYYTRSLTGHGYFDFSSDARIPSLNQHPDAWTKIFPMANATLHAFDWIILLSSGVESETDDRNLIFQYGLGFGTKAKMGHKRAAKGGAPKESLLWDEQWLRNLNSLDYMLWESALELNRLDVVSIHRMKPYYWEALETSQKEKSGKHKEACCGIACNSFGGALDGDGTEGEGAAAPS